MLAGECITEANMVRAERIPGNSIIITQMEKILFFGQLMYKICSLAYGLLVWGGHPRIKAPDIE
jgi:hypothetical protein